MKKTEFKNVTGIILIPAKADGVEGYFAFDTGAMQTALNSNYFSELKGKEAQVGVFDEEVATKGALISSLNELSFGDFRAADLPVLVIDMAYVENALRTVEPDIRFLGSVGTEVFGNVPILLDYEKSVITVEPDINTDGAEKLPLATKGLPVITVELADGPHSFVLDTGANTCLLSAELSEKIAVTPSENTPQAYVIPEIKVGSRVYRDIEAVFSDISQIRVVEVDGIIGYQILSKQLSLLDFPNGALYLF